MQLTGDVHDASTLPANRASIILFIDRSSDSFSVRRESKKALDAFRLLALRHHISNRNHGQSTIKLAKASHEIYQAFSASRGPGLELFPALQKLNLKDKMSVTITDGGKQILLENFISDLQGSSLHEILANLLQKKKELSLSSLAKDAGFQLLSEDLEIKGTEAFPSESELQSSQVLKRFQKDDPKVSVNQDKDTMLQTPVTFKPDIDGESKLTDAASSQTVHEKDHIGKSGKSSAQSTRFDLTKVVANAPNTMSEEDTFTGVHGQIQQKGFNISFFFCDGHFRLLKALTPLNSKIPSVAIIDPTVQKHFILPEKAVFCYSLLSDLVDGFLNGSLPSYQQSETVVQSPRQAPNPPFVNLDFHEVDAIPQVTADTFSELVLGNQSDLENPANAWDRDVLVLFSNNWCGFCQRMETVVREVYRALMGYANVLNEGSRRQNFLLTEGKKLFSLNILVLHENFMPATSLFFHLNIYASAFLICD